MRDYSQDFALEPNHIWLNAASEGPIPKAAAQALEEAARWKLSPHRLTIPKFQQVPLELKNSLSRLIHVPADEIILGNSATYGIHLLANGLKFQAGDEIVLMGNDFPTDILPWLHLQDRGVIVKQIKSKGRVLTPQEISSAVNAHTKAVCLPYVHTFSGHRLDIEAIGHMCRQRGIAMIVNMSQVIGTAEVDVSRMPVDAVVCAGYKWLLGPYGTGFCWMTKALREQLNYPQAYWIALMDEASLKSEEALHLKDDRSARRYDIFCTANFFNYVPWRVSIDYLMNIGLEAVHRHNQMLVDQIVEGLDNKIFEVLSPSVKGERTNIVVFSARDARRNADIFEYLKDRGLYLAFWKGQLRAAPHIYNTVQDIKTLLSVLKDYG